MNYSNILLILIIYFDIIFAIDYDPYKVLNVDKYASSQDIRKAFKQLAKKWHPDKNQDSDAGMKFMQIKQAYELLSDSEQRRLYDQHGIVNEDMQFHRQNSDYRKFQRYDADDDPFEDIFGKHFSFDSDIRFYHKLSITTKYYEETIVPKSKTIPYIMLFYNDWCFRCTLLINAFKKLMENFEPLGIQFVTVNAAYETKLFRKAGVTNLPSLVLVLNGHCYIYRDSSFPLQKIIDFIRGKIPYGTVNRVSDKNLDSFLNGWSDNKVRALMFVVREPFRLRYLLTAFAFRHRVNFGFIQLNDPKSSNTIQHFNINKQLDTILLFNEYTERPRANLSLNDIPITVLSDAITTNMYLTLPRLSSQEVFEGVCPAEWHRPRKRLCIILITENTKDHNFAREVVRRIALQSKYSTEKVRFAYIFKDTQIDFLKALTRDSIDDKMLQMVVLWRRDMSQIKYEWLEKTPFDINFNSFQSKEDLINSTMSKIDLAIQKLLKPTEALTYEVIVQNLFDEHSESLLNKLLVKVFYLHDYLIYNISREHMLALLSLLGTIIFMFAIGYIMLYFVRIEEENLKAKGQLADNTKKGNKYVQELRLHELRAEKYNGMVRLLKPGCRTIILITDQASRQKLIPAFHKAVWAYRKTKTLLFGHMLIEKGLTWYSEILRLSLCEKQTIKINPRNCVGTVLALNGHRKYFCIYHAKHPETIRGTRRMEKITKHLLLPTDDVEKGMLFNEDDSEASEENVKQPLFEDNLLDGLSNWLDRLFEGSTHRYYINYWPDFYTK